MKTQQLVTWFAAAMCMLFLPTQGIAQGQPEQRYSFGKGANVAFLISGWVPPGETFGIWTDGPKAELKIPIGAQVRRAEIILDVTAYLIKQRDWQEITVTVGDRRLGPWRFSLLEHERKITVPIEAKDVKGGAVTLLLLSKDPKSPAELGFDPKDKRKVAIGLRQVTIRELK